MDDITSKAERQEPSINSYGETDIEADNTTDILFDPASAKDANGALTIINGIFGYVDEYEPIFKEGKVIGKQKSENKIWLSLTPNEISPRLSDINLFRPDRDYVVESLSWVNKGTSSAAKALSKDSINTTRKAMTIGNRLQAARIVTNYMQEVLNPKNDSRFGSKDQRVGQASRFLDKETGKEQDRSAFLHIVPDLSASNGRIPIPYAIESKNKDENGGYKIEKYGTAYIPSNFNFVHSKYTLTIKEFILTNVSEQNREIYSMDKTFDGNVLRFFGSHPKIISLNGTLSNFDDDVIGMEKLFGDILGVQDDNKTFQTVTWSGKDGNQTAQVSASGSMRDTFLSYYENFLKGTKAKDYGLRIYLYYNWRIIEGFLVELDISTSGENDNVISFSANMIVKSESTVFEQGVGLGKSVPFNFYSRRFGAQNKTSNNPNGKDAFALTNPFTSGDMAFRKSFRTYAIEQTLGNLNLASQLNLNKENSSDVYIQLLDRPLDTITQTTGNNISTTLGDKLAANLSGSEDLKKLINLHMYRIFIAAAKYNRELSSGSTIRSDNNKAIINMNTGSMSFPWSGFNSFNSWLTDTSELKTFGPWWSYYQHNTKTTLNQFLESFIRSVNIDVVGTDFSGATFRLYGKTSAPSTISATDELFRDFKQEVLIYVYANIINPNTAISFPGTLNDIGNCSLSVILSYQVDIMNELNKL